MVSISCVCKTLEYPCKHYKLHEQYRKNGTRSREAYMAMVPLSFSNENGKAGWEWRLKGKKHRYLISNGSMNSQIEILKTSGNSCQRRK